MQPTKKIVIEKSIKNLILRNPDRFSKKYFRGVLTPYLGYLHPKFGINRAFILDATSYADRHIHRKIICFISSRDRFFKSSLIVMHMFKIFKSSLKKFCLNRITLDIFFPSRYLFVKHNIHMINYYVHPCKNPANFKL